VIVQCLIDSGVIMSARLIVLPSENRTSKLPHLGTASCLIRRTWVPHDSAGPEGMPLGIGSFSHQLGKQQRGDSFGR
jgi:hypothetical protein